MDIFENLEQLNVSEECFEDILSIVESILDEAEGIMPLMKKHKGNKEKAVKEWVKQRNQGLKDAKEKQTETNRIRSNAWKSRKRGDMPSYKPMELAYQKDGQAHKDYLDKWMTNARANNSDIEGVKDKMYVPPLTKDDFIEQNKKKSK